ncbi:hypothetical protein GOODEAATRI_001322 [Goodea atripinnis]|uniref:Uncharacterized protein n=1 Tax=Goodea atripinnis TaxID=208336 RepID=A0ABV0PAK3_9TELE
MKQYDTRGSRIVLICAKRSLCAAFSVLPYGESFYLSDPTLNHPRRRHSSGSISATLEMLPGLEGFQLDSYGRSVSYAQFLYPTNALVRQKPSSASNLTLQIPMSRSTHSIPGRSYPPSRLSSTVGLDLGVEDVTEYDPNLLSDPQWPCGKHKRVLIFASYMVGIQMGAAFKCCPCLLKGSFIFLDFGFRSSCGSHHTTSTALQAIGHLY